MARTVNLYLVTKILPTESEEQFFPTKTGANAFVLESVRQEPDCDCKLVRKTFVLDKEGVAALLNDLLKTCKKKTEAA